MAGLLAGRSEFVFINLAMLALKGVPEPVAACEVGYGTAEMDILAARVAMVGREAELSRLSARLAEAEAGRGGLVMSTGRGWNRQDPHVGRAGRAGRPPRDNRAHRRLLRN